MKEEILVISNLVHNCNFTWFISNYYNHYTNCKLSKLQKAEIKTRQVCYKSVDMTVTHFLALSSVFSHRYGLCSESFWSYGNYKVVLRLIALFRREKVSHYDRAGSSIGRKCGTGAGEETFFIRWMIISM